MHLQVRQKQPWMTLAIIGILFISQNNAWANVVISDFTIDSVEILEQSPVDHFQLNYTLTIKNNGIVDLEIPENTTIQAYLENDSGLTRGAAGFGRRGGFLLESGDSHEYKIYANTLGATDPLNPWPEFKYLTLEVRLGTTTTPDELISRTPLESIPELGGSKGISGLIISEGELGLTAQSEAGQNHYERFLAGFTVDSITTPISLRFPGDNQGARGTELNDLFLDETFILARQKFFTIETVSIDSPYDSDGDGVDDWAEHLAGRDPLSRSGNQDIDNDGLVEPLEILYGTNPEYFDTDGDLLPDNFEIRSNLNPLDSTGENGRLGDPDIDGSSNQEESILGTDPNNPDTDGDGVSDGTESRQGSDPSDASDNGMVDPDDVVEIFITVGDPSQSRSERYTLTVGDIPHVSESFGSLSTANYFFQRGQEYPIRLSHVATSPEFLEKYGTADHDWEAHVYPNVAFEAII